MEDAYLVEPAIGIPSPARDRTVHNSSPKKTEDERWNDSPTLKSTPHNDLDGAGAEEQLVKTKDDLWNVGVADGRSRHNILHSKVGEIAYEWACTTAISQRVAPEHPLKGCDGADHD